MSIIENFSRIKKEYDEMTSLLIRRCRIKSEASYEPNNEYRDRTVQNGHVLAIEVYEHEEREDQCVWISFEYYNDGHHNEEYMKLTVEELEMDDEAFNAHIQKEYAHIARQRETAKRIQENNHKERELRQLAELKAKYGEGE